MANVNAPSDLIDTLSVPLSLSTKVEPVVNPATVPLTVNVDGDATGVVVVFDELVCVDADKTVGLVFAAPDEDPPPPPPQPARCKTHRLATTNLAPNTLLIKHCMTTSPCTNAKFPNRNFFSGEILSQGNSVSNPQ